MKLDKEVLILKCLYFLIKHLKNQDYRQHGPHGDWEKMNDIEMEIKEEIENG